MIWREIHIVFHCPHSGPLVAFHVVQQRLGAKNPAQIVVVSPLQLKLISGSSSHPGEEVSIGIRQLYKACLGVPAPSI